MSDHAALIAEAKSILFAASRVPAGFQDHRIKVIGRLVAELEGARQSQNTAVMTVHNAHQAVLAHDLAEYAGWLADSQAECAALRAEIDACPMHLNLAQVSTSATDALRADGLPASPFDDRAPTRAQIAAQDSGPSLSSSSSFGVEREQELSEQNQAALDLDGLQALIDEAGEIYDAQPDFGILADMASAMRALIAEVARLKSALVSESRLALQEDPATKEDSPETWTWEYRTGSPAQITYGKRFRRRVTPWEAISE